MNKIKFQGIVSKFDNIPVYVDVAQSLNRNDFIVIEYQNCVPINADNKIHTMSQEVQLSYYHINKSKAEEFTRFIIENFKNVSTIFNSYDETLDMHVVFVNLNILFEGLFNGT